MSTLASRSNRCRGWNNRFLLSDWKDVATKHNFFPPHYSLPFSFDRLLVCVCVCVCHFFLYVVAFVFNFLISFSFVLFFLWRHRDRSDSVWPVFFCSWNFFFLFFSFFSLLKVSLKVSSVAHARDFIRHAMGLPGFYRVLPDATDVKWVFSVFFIVLCSSWWGFA